MAGSTSSVHFPARSIGLTSSLIHPKAQTFEEELKKLQDQESSPSTSSNAQLGLRQLVDIYEFVNQKVICSPQAREALHQHGKLTEDALDESIMLVDACDFTIDLIGTLKEQIHDLQSSLRRQRGDYSSFKANVQAYVSFRKKSKKQIAGHLKSLARMQTNMSNNSSPFAKSTVVDQELAAMFNILRRSNSPAISAFRSLLLFLSSPELISTTTTKGTRQNSLVRSIFRRIIRRKGANEVIDVRMMQERLAMLNMSFEAIQEELRCLSRRLIQHRVSLLNILTP